MDEELAIRLMKDEELVKRLMKELDEALTLRKAKVAHELAKEWSRLDNNIRPSARFQLQKENWEIITKVPMALKELKETIPNPTGAQVLNHIFDEIDNSQQEDSGEE